jgi:hypothetical protein
MPRLARLASLVRSYRTHAALLLVVLCVTLLATGGTAARIADPTAADPSTDPPTPAAAEPTATPWPTPTPTPAPPPPLFVPTDWQVYRAHHFALAYPSGWVVNEYVARDYDGPGVSASVSFATPDGTQVVGIDEHESLDPATLKAYCAQPGTHTTYAGLPMISARTGTRLRMFVFVTMGGSAGIAYTLLYTEVGTPDQIKWLYDSIFATFRPEYQTSACT